MLWRSIEKELGKAANLSSRDALVAAYSGSQILDVLEALGAADLGVAGTDADICEPLYDMAAMLPSEAVTGMTQVS